MAPKLPLSISRKPVKSTGNTTGAGSCNFCTNETDTVLSISGAVEVRFCDSCARVATLELFKLLSRDTTAVEALLRFRNKEEKDYIMGQLSDGFGENEMDMRRLHPNVWDVWPQGDTWEHHKNFNRRRSERLPK